MNYNNIDSSTTPRDGDADGDASLNTGGTQNMSKIIVDGIEDDENYDLPVLPQGSQGRQNIG